MRMHAYGLVIYAKHNDKMYPQDSVWYAALIENGIVESSMLQDADRDDDGEVYRYIAGCGFNDPDQMILYEDPDHWSHGVIVGFADGDSEVLPHAEFERRLAEQLGDE